MKQVFKTAAIWVVCLSMLVCLASCAASGKAKKGPAYSFSGTEMARDASGSANGNLRPGMMTAGAWNDNDHYASFRALFTSGQNGEKLKFVPFTLDHWGIPSDFRLTVTVKNGEQSVPGAKVLSYDENGNVTFRAVTDANGVAYLFPTVQSGRVEAVSGDFSASANYDAEHRELSLSLEGNLAKKDVIELMFVVDVTGSMSDEIQYLQAELGDVISRVATGNDAATIRLSFLFYRDHTDTEVFRFVDFRDVTATRDYAVQQQELAKQSASGGGDTPEAVDEALKMAVSKQWTDQATKLIFLVLDAPAHGGAEYEKRYADAVLSAAAQGIRICPVLASGADTLCEYLTRSAAILTGGTTVYITNHSGIGGDHLDPEIPEMVVEHLNLLLVRLINGYHTGTFAEPVAWNASAQTQTTEGETES